jgi:hypothetical protein
MTNSAISAATPVIILLRSLNFTATFDSCVSTSALIYRLFVNHTISATQNRLTWPEIRVQEKFRCCSYLERSRSGICHL